MVFKLSSEQFFSNKHIHYILNSLNDGIFISDAKGNPIWINDASVRFIGYPREKMIGKNVYELEKEGTVDPSVTRIVMESREAVSTVQTAGGRQYLVTGHIIQIPDDHSEYILVHARDITETVKTTVQLEKTEALLKRYSQEIRSIKVREKEQKKSSSFIGKSHAFLSLLDLIEKVADVDTTVLITGETGVGKNVISERIHQLSDRNDYPFLHVNCSAIPEKLIESELFGYKKGAFTGANTRGKVGLVEMANNGTLFLDEISELPIHLQSKLLQLLQNKTYLPVGDTQVRSVDIRIIAATNRNLLQMIKEDRFREDLYYRLNVLPINVPSLHDREEDIFPLLFHHLEIFNSHHHKQRTFSSEVLDILQEYHWPGNIRELENLVERLVITSKGDQISVVDLPERFMRKKEKSTSFLRKEDESLLDMLARIEEEMIIEAYQQYGTTRKAAEALGITQSAFMRRIQKYNKGNDE